MAEMNDGYWSLADCRISDFLTLRMVAIEKSGRSEVAVENR
jgi:hypothetical protein